jgi:hypothetical protein
MRNWTTKEAKLVLEWARSQASERRPLEDVAKELGRGPAAVKEFLRRVLPRGQRPWVEKPRWAPAEIEALQHNEGAVPTRSPAAVKKYIKRHYAVTQDVDDDRVPLTVTQVAGDLGLSRASVYRLLNRGALRRFKGGIAETSFSDLLKDHPEAIPYSRLRHDQKEWLVLNGYSDPALAVKRPSVKGILE